MAVQSDLTPAEAADRLALRELFDAYAHCADRRDAAGQKALFTDDTRFALYMDGEGSEPTYLSSDHSLAEARPPSNGSRPDTLGVAAGDGSLAAVAAFDLETGAAVAPGV